MNSLEMFCSISPFNIYVVNHNKNICCDPSLEPSCLDGSNVGSKRMCC